MHIKSCNSNANIRGKFTVIKDNIDEKDKQQKIEHCGFQIMHESDIHQIQGNVHWDIGTLEERNKPLRVVEIAGQIQSH